MRRILILGILSAAGMARGEGALDLQPVSHIEIPDWMVGSKVLARQVKTRDSNLAELPTLGIKPLTLPKPMEATALEPLSSSWNLLDTIDYYDFNVHDVHEDEVYLLAPTGHLQPFAVVARQYSEVDEDIMRLGYGTGARWSLGKNADLGSEMILFPRDRGWEAERAGPPGVLGDLQFFTRLEIRF